MPAGFTYKSSSHVPLANHQYFFSVFKHTYVAHVISLTLPFLNALMLHMLFVSVSDFLFSLDLCESMSETEESTCTVKPVNSNPAN
jgi:hypothetical protein